MRAIQTWSVPLLLAASPALAQEAQPAPSDAPEAQAQDNDTVEASLKSQPGDIVVVGERLRGQLDTPQKPIYTLNEDEIQSLGVSSVSDLLTRISPQTGSGRSRSDGPPVVMVNGQRISNFREIRNFPPEAIQRVEILPEETALKFGYPPDTRIVNLILKKKFRALAVEEGSSIPTRGGFVSGSLDTTLTRIDGASRFSLNGNLTASSALFEAERGIVPQPSTTPTVAGDPDPTQFRTLIGQSLNYGVNLAWTHGYGKDGLDGTLTLSAAASEADTTNWQGLQAVRLVAPDGSSAIRTLPDPLLQTVRASTLQAGAGYSTMLGRWQFSATLDYNQGLTRTLTDRRADTSGLVAAAAAGTLPIDGALPPVPGAGQDLARSNSNRLDNLVTLIGRPLRVPAGGVSVTVKGGFTLIGFDSSDQRSLASPVSLSRFRVFSGLNVGIPLTSRRENFLPGIGDLTLNLSVDWSHLSDFGAVNGWSSGLTWAPTAKLNLQASYIVTQAAPSISQLGNPLTLTSNVPIYDFSRGETTLVTVTNGGNPLLKKEQERDLKFGLNWTLPVLNGGSNLVVEYFRNRSENVTANFPLLTPEIEAAFPGRVTRDATGRIVAIDETPVTFYQQEDARLRWGLNFSAPIGKAGDGLGGPPGGGRSGPRSGGGAAPGAAGGGRSRGGPGGMGALMGGPGGQPGRWTFGIYHTVQFESRVMVTPGGQVLDLLNGDSLSTSGTPRHSIEFNGGVFYKGFGMFSQGTWGSPVTVAASGAPGTSDLHFGSVTNINLFLFFDFSQRPKLIKKAPYLKGARLTLRFENVLDSHQRVTDGSGTVPLSYQPDYLDPRGRVITLSLRKLF